MRMDIALHCNLVRSWRRVVPTWLLTVDTKVQGARERDMRNGVTIPPHFTAATMLDFTRLPSRLLDVALGPRITFKNFIGTKAASSDAITITQPIVAQYHLSVNWADLK